MRDAWRFKIMTKQIVSVAIVLSVLMQPAPANPVSHRAIITGGGGNGRCTIDVSVDHAAEVEISGDTGLLTTTAGQPAAWRRFQCNAPLPRNPVDFRFGGTNGPKVAAPLTPSIFSGADLVMAAEDFQ